MIIRINNFSAYNKNIIVIDVYFNDEVLVIDKNLKRTISIKDVLIEINNYIKIGCNSYKHKLY